MNFLIFLEIILYIVILLYKYKKYGYVILFQLTTWFIVFYLFYFLYASLCLESFIIIDRWAISSNSVLNSRIIVFSEGAFYILFYAFLNFKRDLTEIKLYPRKQIIKSFSRFFLMASFIIILYSFMKLILTYKTILSNFDYIEFRTQVEKIRAFAHLKLISYILLGLFYYIGLPEKKYRKLFYINFLLIIAFEILSGTRTTLFFVVIIIYLLMVRKNKKTYICVLIPMAIFTLYSSEIMRSIGLQKIEDNRTFVEKLLAGNGEFNNTFITLPYILEHGLESKGNYLDVLTATINWIPPASRIINLDNPGVIYQTSINRGIGYASNFLSNGLYCFGYSSIFLFPLVIVFFKMLDEIFDIRNENYFIIKLFLIVMVRNFCRESITSFNSGFYIVIIYILWIMFFSKKNGEKICIS